MSASAVWVVLLAACSEELEGMYLVERSVISSPCDMNPREPDPVALALKKGEYLKITKDDFLGDTYYTYLACIDEDATRCVLNDQDPLERRDGGWFASSAYAAATEGGCILVLEETSVTLIGGILAIEERGYRESAIEGACTAMEAAQRGHAMPCVANQQIAASRL